MAISLVVQFRDCLICNVVNAASTKYGDLAGAVTPLFRFVNVVIASLFREGKCGFRVGKFVGYYN